MTVDLSAAATRYTSRSTRAQRVDNSWQENAWGFYADTPEVRFAARWVGNAMGMARLYAGRQLPDGTIQKAPAGHRAAELVASIAGGVEGQSQMLKAFGPHLVVAGEGWIVITPPADTTTVTSGEKPEVGWHVLSVLEMSKKGGGLDAEIDGEITQIPADDPGQPPAQDKPLAIRVWDPSPRRHLEADSPVRSSLGLLAELKLLNMAVSAIARSRLTGRGVLLVPKGTRFPTKAGAEQGEDDLIELFMTVAETAYRDPESAAATVPIILEVPAELLGDIKRLTFESDFDTLAIQLRKECIQRFANGLDVPAEVLLGLGDANHWCTLGSVEIMTAAGWKTHDQLTIGEPVLTLNHETGLSEWQPLQTVNTWNVTDEPMVRMKGKRHNSLTTAAHRWPVLTGRPDARKRDWTTSGQLAAEVQQPEAPQVRNTFLTLAAPHADLPTEPKYSDALVELVGWYFTEGDQGIRPGRNAPKMRISQSHIVNPGNCARIERALTAAFGPESQALDKGGRYSTPESIQRRAEAKRLRAENPKMSEAKIGEAIGVSSAMARQYIKHEAKTRDETPRWRRTIANNGQMTRYVLNAAAGDVILEHAPLRVVTLDFVHALTAAQLGLFIDTAIRGDGYLMGGKTPVFGQKDPAMLDAFELAVILSGRSPLRRENTSDGISANGPRSRTQHIVSVSDTAVFAPQARNITEETYTGTIWCPTTPNGTWLARDNNSVFYTGNSAWSITSEAIKMGVEPRLGTVGHALTTQWLQPLLSAEGVADASEWIVWADSAPLRARSNRAETAIKVYELGGISGESLRRETGFDETDAPTEQEKEERKQQAPLPQAEAQPLPADETQVEPSTVASAHSSPGGLQAAADGLIWHALNKAGEKLRRTPACPRSRRSETQQMSASALHTVLAVDADQVTQWGLLDGAFDRAAEIAARYGSDPDCLRTALDTYCRELLAAGQPHVFDYVPAVLSNCATAA